MKRIYRFMESFKTKISKKELFDLDGVGKN